MCDDNIIDAVLKYFCVDSTYTRPYVRVYVRFNSSKSTGRANIEPCTIDLHLGLSVIRVFVTS